MENEKLVEWELDDIMGELRAISLVSAPATEVEELMLFSKEVQNFKTISAEEQIITGLAMRPNIKIPRKDENGELYYGFFSEETVKKAQQLFFKKNSNSNNTNLEHEFQIDGVYTFESWIVADPELDKTKALGFTDVRKGDWFCSMKIDNNDVWTDFIKTGYIKGFSVEIRTSEKEVSLSALLDIVDSDVLSVEEKLKELNRLL